MSTQPYRSLSSKCSTMLCQRKAPGRPRACTSRPWLYQALVGRSRHVRSSAHVGFLSPGPIGFDADLGRFLILSSLVDGMRPDEAFWAAMNARSSMCDKKLGTGHAGDLTRYLVFALWPFTVTGEDCGSARGQSQCTDLQGRTWLLFGLLWASAERAPCLPWDFPPD